MGEIRLSLPVDLQEVVENEVTFGDFADEAAFIESLIREHQQQKLQALADALAEGLGSGTSPVDFDGIIAEARARWVSRGG